MAGKFLSLEETAQHLGVGVDEVHRLVDAKKLFPMRDRTTIKFKSDDVERLSRDLADEVAPTDELSLDLDMPAESSGGGDLSLGGPADQGETIFAEGDSNVSSASHTMMRSDAGNKVAGSGLSISSLAGGSAADISLGDSVVGEAADGPDLDLESIVGASSPSLAMGGQSAITGGAGAGNEPLGIDLGSLSGGGGEGSLAIGSDAGLATSPSATGAGLSISGPAQSGLELDDEVAMSGINLGGDGDVALTPDDGTMLGGDDFELADSGGLGDDESASVVIAESESGDSSFFGAAMAGEGSSLGEESVGLPSSIASEAFGIPGEVSAEMPFNAWQMAGLICCSLLLLFGGFIAYDLVRTIGSPESTVLANPLLDAMADVFGWRR